MLKTLMAHIEYMNTVRDLERLSDRELTDLGIYRPDIRKVAKSAKHR